MRYWMMWPMLALCASPAAAGVFDSVDDRAARVEAQVQGRHDYHAELARNLASIAQDEKAQHDGRAARQFMELAEQAAESGKGGMK